MDWSSSRIEIMIMNVLSSCVTTICFLYHLMFTSLINTHIRTVPENLFNFTLGACLNCCVRSKGQEEPPSPSPDDNAIADIKMKLKFYFMNPFEKWKFRDKRRFPWKLFMQLASIILVTWQVLSYRYCLE